MNNRVHQQFGNYQLLRLIGKGGFAEVYLGEHLQLGSQVAVKILNTQLMTREQEEFLEEAHILGSLQHPSIIQILDCGIREEDDTPFLVMNYAPNGTLRQRHPKGEALALPLVASYAKQIASALQYAHNKKLIHRDIKPENMLIGAEQELLLSDFGIALISSSSASQSTKATAGTMAYMAPEQIMGKPRMASDQYALGVVVYEWLCGERPFQGGFSELCAQHLYAPPPSLREKNPAISSTLEKIVCKALAKDPLQRYATIRDFGEALEQYNLRVERGEEEKEDPPRAEATQIRGIQILSAEQDEDRNTIEQMDSSFLPAELAHAQDAAPSPQDHNMTDATQQDKEESVYVLEKTHPTTPFNINATTNTVELVQEGATVHKNAQTSPQLPEGSNLDTRRARLHLEPRHFITLLMIVLVIGSSLGLMPLIFNMAYKDPGQSAYAQLATTTTRIPGYTPTPGAIPTQEKSPTGVQSKQLSPVVSATQPPQLIVTAGNTEPTTIFVPTPTPTRIVKLATPTPVPTATPMPTATPTMTPTPTPTMTPTPTPTPGVTATPTSTPTPPVTSTPAGIQPTLQSNPANIVNEMNNNCGGDTHGGVGYVDNCSLTLSNTSGSAQILNWTGSTSNTSYHLSPSSGSIAPGQSELISVTIGVQCPLSFTVIFTGQANTVTVPIICTQISVTPGAQDFSSSNCTRDSTGYYCYVTVKAYASNVADTNWSVTSTTPGPLFAPSSGTLAPGASVQIFLTIPASSCPGTNSLDFFVPGSAVDGFDNYLGWSC